MGTGKAGNFGNTTGNKLDTISNILTLASLVPGFDTFADLAAIPIDLLRRDFLSAGLDAAGVVPLIGEIADTAKLAKMTDKVVDAMKMVDKTSDTVKAAKRATNFSNYPKQIHIGKQGKHIVNHNNYVKGKSILSITTEKAQKLINEYSGTGKKIGQNRERVDFKKIIGKYVDPKTGKKYDTTVGTIHYSKTGTHIVPEKPANWRK